MMAPKSKPRSLTFTHVQLFDSRPRQWKPLSGSHSPFENCRSPEDSNQEGEAAYTRPHSRNMEGELSRAAYPPLLMCSDAICLQLRKPLPSGDIVNTLGNIRVGTEIPDTDKLDSAKKLSSYFPKQPVKRKLHLVVQVPPSGKY